ncbi:putative membrane protein [Streptococcus saliviloxodontae]|uniref:Membrane protein n=2 Tax=Streptococcus saliviloxodontae TaxID=1349416 RepID=A0ABS2PNC8_9STRE|nr:putative membrane protein [Streptococcus saliviloxodontae]
MTVKKIKEALDGSDCLLMDGNFLSELDPQLRELVTKDYPHLKSTDFISNIHLAHYRLIFMNSVIEKANRKNDYIKDLVYNVTKDMVFPNQDIQEELDSKITFGQRVADIVARFGGSWTFIISFIVFMAIWMAINVIKPFGISFDEYPFILLNLALSTIAAIQAPLIMMSQNRASDYDRLQAKNDYQVNRISEEEIRLLHTKIDHLVQQDQSDLLEIQKLQTEMLLSLNQQISGLEEALKEVKREKEL